MPPNNEFGINLIGYSTANLGLGHTAREFARVLLAQDIPLCIYDIDPGHSRSNFDKSLTHLTVADVSDLLYDVNLFIAGANSLNHWVFDLASRLNHQNKINVMFIWWELPHIPDHLVEAVKIFDVLIAGSEFIQSTLMNNIPGIPVLLARHPLNIPDNVVPNRIRFGIPVNQFCFCTGFEPYSDPERKNPFAAIKAFQMAFPEDDGVHLIIKINNAPKDGTGNYLLTMLYALAAQDKRIMLIKQELPYPDLLSFYASCDAFVSLHRAEGLGLVPLEAMRLGKPVVSTAWSGNMSYMNYNNAALVRFDFIQTSDKSQFYGPSKLGIQSYWAEPSIEHAAAMMKRVVTDNTYRAKISQHAQADSNRYDSTARKAAFIKELVTLAEMRETFPKKNVQDIQARINSALRIKQLKQLPPFKRFIAERSHAFKQLLNRHVFWRFK